MANYYLITSESYSNTSVGEYPMWNRDESKLIISASSDYNYPYSQSFDGYDDIMSWVWDYSTNEFLNWTDDDDPNDDQYGIDGPFPETLDSTNID